MRRSECHFINLGVKFTTDDHECITNPFIQRDSNVRCYIKPAERSSIFVKSNDKFSGYYIMDHDIRQTLVSVLFTNARPFDSIVLFYIRTAVALDCTA